MAIVTGKNTARTEGVWRHSLDFGVTLVAMYKIRGVCTPPRALRSSTLQTQSHSALAKSPSFADFFVAPTPKIEYINCNIRLLYVGVCVFRLCAVEKLVWIAVRMHSKVDWAASLRRRIFEKSIPGSIVCAELELGTGP